MSKPRDPVLAVLRYFEEAELPLAQQALSLAQHIVKQRAPGRPRARLVTTHTAKKPAVPVPVAVAGAHSE